MWNNKQKGFTLRRFIAICMVMLVMLGANGTALTAEGQQTPGTGDETVTETVTQPSPETTEELNDEPTGDPTGDQKKEDQPEGQTEGQPEVSEESKEPTDNPGTDLNPEGNAAPAELAESKLTVAPKAAVKEEPAAKEPAAEAEKEPAEEAEKEEAVSEEEADSAESAEVEPVEKRSYEFAYSYSKKATNLDSNYETEITLSLPSAERKLESDVVFALDKSTYSDFNETITNATALLEDLKKSGAKIKVGIVVFNRIGHPSGWFDLDTQYDEILEQFKQQYSGGSNMHAGMLAAKKMLEEDTKVDDDRKHLVLISDGSTYLHCKNNDYSVPYSRSYVPVEKGKGTSWGGYWVEGYWNPYVKGSDEAGNVRRPKTEDETAWLEYLNDVKARNAESHGDDYDYVWEYYDSWEKGAAGIDVIKQTYKETPSEFRTASNTDISYLRCYETWQELQKYHTYTICVKDNGTTNQDSAIGFMRLLNEGRTPDFERIRNKIKYYLSAKSSVDDYMGYTEDYNFDLTSMSDMKLSVENSKTGKTETYKGTEISANRYGFCPMEDGSYRFEVEYTAGNKKEEEHFTWYINDSITNFERVSLTYKEKLTNPKTEPGTYGQYDEDGSKGYKELFTNRSAVLHPIDSMGEKGADQEFPMPTVSYTVKKPEPTPTPTPTPTSKPTPTPEPESNPKSTPTPTPDYVVTCQMAGYPADYVWNENVKACVPGFRRTKVPNTSDKGLAGNFVSFLFSTVTGVAAAYILKKY